MKKQRKGFTLIELLIVVVIVGILALAAIPLITANTRDARRSEGEQLLGSMKNRVKVAYTKTGEIPGVLVGEMGGTTNGAGVETSELTGKYFIVADTVGGTAPTFTLTADPNTTGSGAGVTDDGTATGTFNIDDPGADAIVWATGGS